MKKDLILPVVVLAIGVAAALFASPLGRRISQLLGSPSSPTLSAPAGDSRSARADVGLPEDMDSLQRDLTPPPLPEKDTYLISSKEPGPKIYEATFDPLGKIAPGAAQKITVKVRHEKAVDAVKVTLILDDNSFPLSLARKEGSPQDGVWKGEWVIPEDYAYTFRYQAAIEARSGTETSKAVLTFR